MKVFQYRGKPLLVSYREHVPPDPGAAMNWLKNRRPDVWRDVQRHEHAYNDLDQMSDEQLRRYVLEETKAITQAMNNNRTKH